MNMNIEPGKKYKRRDGAVAECYIKICNWFVMAILGNMPYVVSQSGRVSESVYGFVCGPGDLIAEWSEPRTLPEITVTYYGGNNCGAVLYCIGDPPSCFRDFPILARIKVTAKEGEGVE